MNIEIKKEKNKRHIAKIQTAVLAIVLLPVLLFLSPSVLGATDEVADPSPEGENLSITARKAFSELPISVLDILSRSKRLDMLDYFDVDSILQATNTLGGPSTLETVKPDYLKVKLTPVSTLEVCILPRKAKGDIVMTLYTIGGKTEAPDTELRFFTSDLKPIETSKIFKMPEMKEYFNVPKSAGVKVKDLEQEVAFPTAVYTATPGTPYKLTGRLTVDSYLPVETKDKIAPYISTPLEWEWDGQKWKKK